MRGSREFSATASADDSPYQVNLAIFGLASIAAAFAPSMTVLIACRFVIGVGLGAEIVVGYATLTEFVPASSRGRWIGLLAVITNFSLFASSMIGLWVIPTLGWRYMFGIVGVLAMFVWILRKSMPESPRWLAAHGRDEEAEEILQAIEAEAAHKGPLPPVQSMSREEQPAGSVWKLFQPPYLGRTLLGSLLHIVVGFSLYGFIGWLPTFLIKDGHSMVSSLGYTTLMSLGGPVGSLIGLALADIVGRKASIVGSSLTAAAFGLTYPFMSDGAPLALVGFCLVSAIYVMLATGFAMHVPELFPNSLPSSWNGDQCDGRAHRDGARAIRGRCDFRLAGTSRSARDARRHSRVSGARVPRVRLRNQGTRLGRCGGHR